MVTQDLRETALRHLWMQAGGWRDMAEDGEPIIVSQAKGLTITDTDGRRWLDVNGGYGSVNIGYGRTEIAAAVLEQMSELAYYPEQTATVPTIKLAEKLSQLAPGRLERSWLVAGGSEANETAIKMARAYHARRGESSRYKIISRSGSYHGATAGVAWLGRSEAAASLADYEPAPLGFVYVPQPYPYRCEFGGKTPSECAILCAEAVERAILMEGPETVAALIGEPIVTAMGAIVPGDEYWPMVRRICDSYGVLLIDDEIVCGFGRTGRMFGIEHYGVVPDIMTVAKGLGSSYVPIGSVIATTEVADVFAGEDNIFHAALTAGGHPVSTTAALTNLELIEKEGLVERSAELGTYFLDVLNDMASSHPVIGDVRGLGLCLAVEFVSDRQSKSEFCADFNMIDRMTEKFRRRGLLLRMLSPQNLQMCPPLCITRTEIDEIVSGIDSAVTEMEDELKASL